MNKKIFYATYVAIILSTAAAQAHEGEDGKATTQIGGASLQLIVNNGQLTDQNGKLRPDIDAKAEQGGVTMFVGDGQLHYQWVRSQKQKEKSKNDKEKEVGFGEDSPVSIYRMDVTLVGADKAVEPIFEEATGYYENYYLGHTGEDGVQAKGYGRVVYKNVYKGIDWVIYVENSKENINAGAVLKYDFIVHPGGDVGDILLRYDGATELRMEDGALVAVTPYGSITEAAPYSYVQGSKKEVVSNYILEGNELRFGTGSYSGTLVIDPTLGWATYFGGTANDRAYDVETDTAGNVYMCGHTSNANMATNGTHQQSLGGQSDCFVVKFTSTGSRAWATYYGGSGGDYAADLVADRLGYIYMLGRSYSTSGIATNGAYQDTLHPSTNSNSILVKLNSSNGTRLWGTYYLYESSSNIECDAQGNIYFSGQNTVSITGAATTGVYMTTPTIYMLSCFNANGQRVWATYYDMNIHYIHYDIRHNAFYHASHVFTPGLATTGAWQSTFGGGSTDGYIAQFTTGGFRQWGTYYGGTGNEGLYSMATDTAGNIYVVGQSWSSNAIATTGTHQPTIGSTGVWDGVLVKFTASGQRVWGTYYGGTKQDFLYNIVIDARQKIHVAGDAQSTNGIASTNGYKTSLSGSQDLIIAQFNANTGQREWGTYYGGSDGEDIAGLACAKGKIYMTGNTGSSTGIANSGGFQQTLGGNNDAMLIEWYADTAVDIREPFNDTVKCTGEKLVVPYYVTQNFRNGNVFTVQMSNSSGSFASPVNIGVVTANVAGVINCTIPLNASAGTGYKLRIVATAPIDTSLISLGNFNIKLSPASATAAINKNTFCTGDTLFMTSSSTTTGATYKWTGPNSFSLNTANGQLPAIQTLATGDYINTIDANGCMVKDTFSITVNQTPQNLIAGNNGPVCAGNVLQLTSSSTTNGVTYSWSPGNYSTNNVTIPNAQTTQSGTYTVSAKLGNCTAKATTAAIVEQEAVITIIPLHGDVVCTGVPARFAGHANSAGTNPQYQWQVNGVDVPGATAVIFQSNTLKTGDKVRLKVKPNTSCPSSEKFSTELSIIVMPSKTLTLYITSSSNPPWGKNEMITFNTKYTNAHGLNGELPTFQWKRNGTDIIGANYDYWAVNTESLSGNDVICVFIKSAYQCSQPDTMTSNCINAQFTGVDDVNGIASQIKVYPNPVGEAPLYLSPKGRGLSLSDLSVELYDVVGRKMPVVYSNGSINMSGLPAGNYVLQVSKEGGAREYFKVVKR